MVKVEMWTRNGDKTTVHTDDPAKIRELEDSPFDDNSNISSTRVTNDG